MTNRNNRNIIIQDIKLRLNIKLLLILSVIFLLFGGLNIYSQTVSTYSFDCGITDDIVIDNEGNLFGSNFMTGVIYKVTPEGEVSEYFSGLDNSNGLVFDEDENLFVADLGGDQIYKITSEQVAEPYGPSVDTPSGLIFRPGTSDLYFTTYTTNDIKVLDADGNITTLIENGDLFNGPVGMTFDENGILYISNFSDGKILKYDYSNDLALVADLPGYIGFIKYHEGYIYATGYNTHKIYKVSLDGEIFDFAGEGTPGHIDGPAAAAKFNIPNGIVFSNNFETLYISEYSNEAIRSISELYVGLDNDDNTYLNDFILEQNYPNPFNPITKIIFKYTSAQLSNFRSAEIVVYNTTGQEVWSSPILDRGLNFNGSIFFNGSNFNSGIYYYSIVIDGIKRDTKSMILIK